MTIIGQSPFTSPFSAPLPIKRVKSNRRPTTNDWQNFELGDEWLDESSMDWYKLASLESNIALWTLIGGTGGAIQTLEGDAGGQVSPNAANNLFVLTGDYLTTTGTPASNTLTVTSQGVGKITPDNGDVVEASAANNVNFTSSSISITGTAASNTVNFESPGGVSKWNVITTNTQLVPNQGYICNNLLSINLTLPPTATIGNNVIIIRNQVGLVTIKQNAGQTTHFGAVDTTPGIGGDVIFVTRYNTLEIVNTITDTDYVVVRSIGNFTIN